jgi:hypothetical protein
MIGNQVRADHPVGDILTAFPLDPPRGAIPLRIRVQQQRDHHRRVIRRPAMTIAAVVAVERAQVQLLDRAQDAPHEVILRDPIQQRRRQQNRWSRPQATKFQGIPEFN